MTAQQMELTGTLGRNAEREDKPKRSKKVEEPKPTLGEKCVICHNIFAKRKPTECRCICDKCAEQIRAVIEAMTGGQNDTETDR